MIYHTPLDTEQMTKKYKIDKGGICGQSCIAVIERSSISNVLENWKDMGLEWKGWSGWRQLRKYLENRGYKVKLLRIKNLGNFNYNNFYICRVQWLGDGKKQGKPFYGWGHWSEASAHTHFIVIENNKKFFCNDDGCWFNINELDKYLKHYKGVITSAMEVFRER